MATDLPEAGDGLGQKGRNLELFEANLKKIDDLTKRLVAVMAKRRKVPQALQGPGQDIYLKAATAWMSEAMKHPAKIIELQAGYWGRTLATFAEAQAALAKGEFRAPEDPGPKDKRFANPLWDTHPWFNLIKKQYLTNAEAMQEAVRQVEGLTPREKKKLEYFSRQIVDMLAPTNFLATNPDALEKAVATEGQSLVDGLENLVHDLERNDGELIVRLADEDAFTVGGNIATSPGEVVHRNRMFELIQYKPTTEQVREVPLLIFPPWINKFYILDLKPQNSLIKWIVDQGFTLFVVSWVNPDASYKDVALGDYIEDGFFAALREVKAICGTDVVNAVGYCIAGTTLSLTLALMDKRGDRTVNSATFLTTLTDFSDQGEMAVFLDDDFVDGIETESTQKGILESFYMARTFSYLRSNDLIYQPAIRSYMMGETPPAFDLLYWNGDGTNLPARMAVEYLRGLCQSDRFATTGYPILGETVRISEVKVPLCAIACETDHIAGWKSSYRGVQAMGSEDKTFILSESGHIAGIVNPPTKKKYGHWINSDLSLSPEEWLQKAEKHPGSWWPRWTEWLAQRSGGMVPAREPGDAAHPPLAPAPGTYVTAQPDAA
ncbi:Polyhydroxyalkanoic acid synthase [Rubellimicrobium mesophilum DSM 19309]|uniref:Polyhydroxyalkanoic acid synthase n=1 Tax=Rubellimicrobium mesophilum DSM 19309 TaxID=442562 RepID=A0A017HVY8_9RHOB|nr:class I poly(R)-hydroxyalkanoic acid synthase [Rubellimicrobium mesophilum]EYD78338.1 Polyhydroxyalkanoic acid synthase [Rubellimicrobium mesophilum DSM 19309]